VVRERATAKVKPFIAPPVATGKRAGNFQVSGPMGEGGPGYVSTDLSVSSTAAASVAFSIEEAAPEALVKKTKITIAGVRGRTDATMGRAGPGAGGARSHMRITGSNPAKAAAATSVAEGGSISGFARVGSKHSVGSTGGGGNTSDQEAPLPLHKLNSLDDVKAPVRDVHSHKKATPSFVGEDLMEAEDVEEQEDLDGGDGHAAKTEDHPSVPKPSAVKRIATQSWAL
jgi:hypothetical protein